MNEARIPIDGPSPLAARRLPELVLAQYLLFLTKRPVSQSNRHYLESRLASLRALAKTLSGTPELDAIVARLAHLQPGALALTATDLQFALYPLIRAARVLPENLVVQDDPPPCDWLAQHRSALLVLGPGIGIGDELILTPLPKWLRAAHPELQVDVLSGYDQLWTKIRHVRNRSAYRDFFGLLAALTGQPPYDGYDLVVFADFESPELYRGVAFDGRVPSYLELSLGGRSAFYLDNRLRWLHRVQHVTTYGENYYFGLDEVLRRLGLAPQPRGRLTDVFEVAASPPEATPAIFVSPFTSKYEPSEAYWSLLLGSMFADWNRGPVEVRIDSGKHRTSEAFAVRVATAAAAHVPNDVAFAVARSEGRDGLALADVFDELQRACLVVCTDSFAAHAASLARRPVFVVAREGVEAWRVPSPTSFYIDGSLHPRLAGQRMRSLWSDLSAPRSAFAARFTHAETGIVELVDELESEAAFDHALDRCDALHELLASAVRGGLRRSTPQAWMLEDTTLERLERPRRDLATPTSPAAREALARHLRHHFDRWRNTNYVKYLRACLDGAGAS